MKKPLYITYKYKLNDNLTGGARLHAEQTKMLNRMQGMIYGGCVGDALGSRYEFESEANVKRMIEDDMNDGFLDILGGGPFEVAKGQITDDSEMTICLLKSISDRKIYDQQDAAKRYIKWNNTDPFDIGNTIKASLRTTRPALNNIDMKRNSQSINASSLSNGVLMRIAPLSIVGLYVSESELKKYVYQDCELTHPNEIIKDAAFIYCLTLKCLLSGLTIDQTFDYIRPKISTSRVRIVINDSLTITNYTFIIDCAQNIELHATSDSQAYQGYFGIAMQNAFYELRNGKDFETSMMRVLSYAGDTDTNLAITGSLLGAYYGYNKINKKWIDSIMNAKYKRIEKYPFLSVKKIDKYITKLYKHVLENKQQE